MTAPPNPPEGYPPYQGGGYPPQQPGYGGPVSARPGMLTAAAVLAFIVAGLEIIGGFVLLGLSTAFSSGLGVVFALLYFVLAAGFILGGVQTIAGKDTRIIVIVAGAALLLTVISWAMGGFSPLNLVGVAIEVLIIAFALNQQSKAWIASKRGNSF